jgi:MFS family permease
MKKKSIKARFINTFVRDVDISRSAFLYLFLTLFALILMVEVTVLRYVLLNQINNMLEFEIILALFIIGIGFLISGYLVDRIMNKTRNFNLVFFVCIIGLFLSTFKNTFFDHLGILIFLVGLTQLTSIWFSTLIHFTTILNRGRITAYLLIISVGASVVSVLFAYNDFLYNYFFIFMLIILAFIYFISKKNSYIETSERLESPVTYKKIIFEKHFFRYSTSFFVLSFILGDLVARFTLYLNIIVFSIATVLYLIVAGCFLDNIGRKISIVLGILVLSFFLITYGSYIDSPTIFGLPRETFLSLHYAFSLAPLVLAIFTISGDFSTERQNIKYRGRINGFFMALVFFGVIIGFIFSRTLNLLYSIYPALNNIIPEFPNRLNSFLLVMLLVWMMAVKEILVSKEKDWASSIILLLVFHNSSVCLYDQKFKADNSQNPSKLDENVISGALTGILKLISEITQSKKWLRKIDKDGNYLYFAYGKFHVTTLISSMDLPVLSKKLDSFSKDFGTRFEKELKSFVGNVSVFEDTKYIVEKYFNQKYSAIFEL